MTIQTMVMPASATAAAAAVEEEEEEDEEAMVQQLLNPMRTMMLISTRWPTHPSSATHRRLRPPTRPSRSQR
jgi:hypothetical protein